MSGSEDGSIKIFDLLEARPIYDLLGHKGSVTSVRFSPKGDYMASGESNNLVYVWKTNFDVTDKELGKVAPSTEKQSNDKLKYSKTSPARPLRALAIWPHRIIGTKKCAQGHFQVFTVTLFD